MARSAMIRLLCLLAAGGLLLVGCKPERKEQVKAKVKAAVHAVAESRPVQTVQKVLPKRAVPAKLAAPRVAAAAALAAPAAAAASADIGSGMAGYTALYRNGVPSSAQERAQWVQTAILSQDFAAADALANSAELKSMVAEGRRQKAEADREERLAALADLEPTPGAER